MATVTFDRDYRTDDILVCIRVPMREAVSAGSMYEAVYRALQQHNDDAREKARLVAEESRRERERLADRLAREAAGGLSLVADAGNLSLAEKLVAHGACPRCGGEYLAGFCLDLFCGRQGVR